MKTSFEYCCPAGATKFCVTITPIEDSSMLSNHDTPVELSTMNFTGDAATPVKPPRLHPVTEKPAEQYIELHSNNQLMTWHGSTPLNVNESFGWYDHAEALAWLRYGSEMTERIAKLENLVRQMGEEINDASLQRNDLTEKVRVHDSNFQKVVGQRDGHLKKIAELESANANLRTMIASSSRELAAENERLRAKLQDIKDEFDIDPPEPIVLPAPPPVMSGDDAPVELKVGMWAGYSDGNNKWTFRPINSITDSGFVYFSGGLGMLAKYVFVNPPR